MTTRKTQWFGIVPQMLVGALTFSPVMAQDEENTERLRIHMQHYQTKPQMVSLFENTMRSRRDAEQAYGMGFYFVFERVVGKKHHYVTFQTGDGSFVVPYPYPPEWHQAVQMSYDDQTLLSLEVYGETVVNETPEPLTQYMVVQYRTVSPSNDNAYGDWLVDELMPALQERNSGDIRFVRVALGDNTNKFITFRFVDEWPTASNVTLDNELQAIYNEGNEMVLDSQDYLYIYRKDLSFSADPSFFRALFSDE